MGNRIPIWAIVLVIILLPCKTASAGGSVFVASADSNGISGNAISNAPSLTTDSQLIAFSSAASNLISNDTNAVADIFILQQDILQPGRTILGMGRSVSRVSVASDGSQANAASSNPSISATSGRYVVFASSATNLVSADTNEKDDIFLHDRTLGTTTRISVPHDLSGSPSGEANGHSYNPRISADGCYIVFSSDASNLEALSSDGLAISDTNEKRDIFLYYNPQGDNGCSGSSPYIELISLGPGDTLANGDSNYPHIESLRFVSFTSDASNLVSGDTNNLPDIFVRDRAVSLGGQTVPRVTLLASQSSDGALSNGASYTSSIQGNLVAYDSNASNLVSGDVNGKRDIFVRHLSFTREAATTSLESTTIAGAQGNGDSYSPSLAAGGNYLAFASDADNFSERTDCNSASDIFVRDYLLGTLRRVNLSISGFQSEKGKSSLNPSIARDGFLVAYESDSPLVPSPSDNGVRDVFVSLASLDPNSLSNPLTNGQPLDEAPDICVNGRNLEVFLEDFSDVSTSSVNLPSSLMGTGQKPGCKPAAGKVCYDISIIPKNKSSDTKRKIARRNDVTIRNLKPGTYHVSYRASGRLESRTISSERSPVRRVVVSRNTK